MIELIEYESDIYVVLSKQAPSLAHINQLISKTASIESILSHGRD